jgi:hypothetical protein
MCLHNGVRDEGCRDLFAAKPASIQTLYGLSGGIDDAELQINLALIIFSNQTSRI